MQKAPGFDLGRRPKFRSTSSFKASASWRLLASARCSALSVSALRAYMTFEINGV